MSCTLYGIRLTRSDVSRCGWFATTLGSTRQLGEDSWPSSASGNPPGVRFRWDRSSPLGHFPLHERSRTPAAVARGSTVGRVVRCAFAISSHLRANSYQSRRSCAVLAHLSRDHALSSGQLVVHPCAAQHGDEQAGGGAHVLPSSTRSRRRRSAPWGRPRRGSRRFDPRRRWRCRRRLSRLSKHLCQRA